MQLIDWVIVAAYVLFALGVGVYYARRASRNVDEFFLSGRSLPWWLAGTSMVATTFAIDTPLVLTGLVRDDGIWKNWLWWCFAVSGVLTVFLFARYWRRGEVMTTAELSELRYGGADAKVLRGFLGFLHAGVTNTNVMAWVLLAAGLVGEVLFDFDRLTAVAVAAAIALTYSLLAGFWGVVITDFVQFIMATVGAIALAVLALQGVGGLDAVEATIAAGGWSEHLTSFLPPAGEGSPFGASFWTAPVAAVAVYLGVSWWASQSSDGGTYIVQRIAATRDEKQGVLAALWFQVANYAVRPWPWFLVALASIVVLPQIVVSSPVEGKVTAVGTVEADGGPARGFALVQPAGGGEAARLEWEEEGDWHAAAVVEAGAEVAADDVLARTNSERAYVVMMVRYLPVGLLGLVVASLLAAFMSTIDTHVNLASSFFVNDIYRRFLVRSAPASHYVWVARGASVVVLGLASLIAWQADSIKDMFTFFLAFLGGVGPIYVLRWLWWRVRASTEIAAMLASSVSAVALTFLDVEWRLGPLSPGGELTDGGRLILVVLISLTVALFSLALTPAPDPRSLVEFYRRVRPMGFWRPVRHHCRDIVPRREALAVLGGLAGGLGAIYGLLFGIGHLLFGRIGEALMSASAVVIGAGLVIWALAKLGVQGRPDPSR